MNRKPSRDPKIIFVEPQGGCDAKRLSIAPHLPISEKSCTASSVYPDPIEYHQSQRRPPDSEVFVSRDKSAAHDLGPEARQNLLGFFQLLLEVDRRNNPHLYSRENRKIEPTAEGLDTHPIR
jgi:hypothetical protein